MSLRQVSVPIAAGGSEYFPFNGNYLRAKTAPYDVTVENVDDGGRDVFALSQGEDALFDKEYKRLKITNNGGADAVFVFTIGKNAKVNSAIVSGSVVISSQAPSRATGSNANPTVTNASAQLVAANPNRIYLLIQNKDTSGDIYINFGAAATVANGVLIPAGGSYEMNCNALTAAINAIGSIASNANIVVVEG